LEPEDLDRLGIFDTSHRTKLLEAARALKNSQLGSLNLSEPASFSKRRSTSSSNRNNSTGFGESSSSSNINRFGVQLPYQFEYYKPPASLHKCPAEVKAAVEVHVEAFPRDSGVYVGRDEGEDPAFISGSFLPLETESEEIILSPNSPMNLFTGMTSTLEDNAITRESRTTTRNTANDEASPSDPYEGVRSRFLEHKNFFESVGLNAAASQKKGPPQQPSEKSSDSGISVCANSPTSPVTQRKEYRT